MASERKRLMKLNELREQAVEALDQAPYIDVETENGEVFRVWHPLLVDDDSQARIDRFNAGEDLDKDDDGGVAFPARISGKLAEPASVRSSRAILGPAIHKAFIKAGGHSNDIQLAWNEMVREHREANDLLAAVGDDPK